MVLPGVTLFPNALLPLFIFEPRYQVMLEDALGTGRMLVMAMPCHSEQEELVSIAGVGLVRACIRNPDDTSNLILQGVSRVRFTAWEQIEPYRVAQVEILNSLAGDQSDAAELAFQVTRLHALCARLKERGMELPVQFETYLNQITNVSIITDLVASTLVADSAVRQRLLEELDVSKRLSMLLTALQDQLG